MSFNMAAPSENSIVQNESRADSFPIKTKQTSTTINGEKVEILCSHFSDRLFVVVTQLNKLGTMVEVTRDVVLNDGMGTQKPALSTKVLLGVDEPLTHVVAKNLVSKIESVKPILLSMALKDTSAETVRSLAEVVKEVTIS